MDYRQIYGIQQKQNRFWQISLCALDVAAPRFKLPESPSSQQTELTAEVRRGRATVT